MAKSIRINDLAEALGLSRNTVSKALNGKHIPEKTRKIILEKAIAMGYKCLDVTSADAGYLRNQRILLITSHPLANLNFFISIIRGLEATLKKYEFELLQYTFSPNTTYRELNSYIKLLNIDGIVCVETFDQKLTHHLLSLEIPIVFIDFCGRTDSFEGRYDIVLMENVQSVQKICRNLIEIGHKKTFGFVGDFNHCLGFAERFIGMKEALFEACLPYDPSSSIVNPDTFPYGNVGEMKEELKKKAALPDVFVCANDSIAIPLIRALNALDLRVPEDISVVGFDDSAEGRINNPTITTVQIDKEYLGKEALLILLNRIKHPADKNKIIHIQTIPLYRESTPRLNLKRE